jgi:UDP-N-acetylbacillosamine N-acetyltransferase
MSGSLFIVGAGGHGKVIADAARAAGRRVLGFFDARAEFRGSTILGLPVIVGDSADLARRCAEASAAAVLGIGDNRRRAALFAELCGLGVPITSVIHPSAVVAPSVEVGAGVVALAGAIVNPDTRVEDGAILNTGVRVDHDSVIGAHVHLSPGVALGGTVRIGEGTHLGVGVSVRNNVTIGTWSTVGVGAVVIADVPDRVVAYGVPARVVRSLPAPG